MLPPCRIPCHHRALVDPQVSNFDSRIFDAIHATLDSLRGSDRHRTTRCGLMAEKEADTYERNFKDAAGSPSHTGARSN